MRLPRRRFLRAGAVVAAWTLAGGVPRTFAASTARVVVIGGGYGGATAARYLRLLDPSIEVVLVEPNEAFVSCPLSNMVLGGFKAMADITRPYDGLAASGVRVVRDSAVAIDADKRQLRLARGDPVAFERVIVAPGVDFMWDELPAMRDERAQATVLHAWKAGPQTAGLRRQLEEMRDGGVFVISIPEAPFRCPPGPYERACQVAAYFKRAKRRSKVIIADANEDVLSKGALFKRAWADLYPGLVEYQPNSKAIDVDVAGRTLKLEFGDLKGDVLNVLPPMKAGNVAAPFITANGRWCEVDWLTYESKAARFVHILGDSLQIAPLMPKSATMANGHGKVCASAIVELVNGRTPNPSPTLVNTCYSMVSEREAVHVASVHKYDEKDRTMKTVPGAGGLSPAMSDLEGDYAMSWARNIWADALGA
ncbi:MAG TPA: NAD(P)/FAD-dependent oxidoreductase [Usitatibacter sp.]|nr:NAD(P)/FAD-dependent oxidoreductase [Usitatibacter sp.]